MDRSPLDDYGTKLLKRFADAANKTTLHPFDWDRFHEFIVYTHQRQFPAADHHVVDVLIAKGFAHAEATRLGSFYSHARDLLAVYDQARSGRGDRRS